MPIRKGDGTAIESLRLGDGTGIAEVRKGDGTVLFSAFTDGESMYITDFDGETVESYDLSTPYDISTATANNSFSTSSEESNPEDVVFNPNGSKMFTTGTSSDNINEYSLSTAFDITTATFENAFDVSSEDGSPQGMAFNTDGTKMYFAGVFNSNIYEYDLSTAFDTTTASFSTSFDTSSEDTPLGVAWNTDGTKMYTAGATDVYEYDLSTAFDISTASFTASVDLSADVNTSKGIAFDDTGDKLYISDRDDVEIIEYDLSTQFDITTASFTQSFDVSGEAASPTAITFNTVPQY